MVPQAKTKERVMELRMKDEKALLKFANAGIKEEGKEKFDSIDKAVNYLEKLDWTVVNKDGTWYLR